MRTRPYVLRTRSLRSHHLVPGCRPLRMRSEGCACAPTRTAHILLKCSSNGVILDPSETPFFMLFQGYMTRQRAPKDPWKVPGMDPKMAKSAKNGQTGHNLDFDGFIYYPNKNDHVQWKKNHYSFFDEKKSLFSNEKK